MSIMNPLPPQAYTKDTLVQAYAWLQSQSENIKELATTPDVLVSLYLKAKLQGDRALERPSIQNFKNELKNLAGMIGEFEVIEQQNSTRGNSTDMATSTIRFRSQNLNSTERTTTTKPTQLNLGSIPSAHSANQTSTAAPTPPPQQSHYQASYHSAPAAPTPANSYAGHSNHSISENPESPKLDSRTLDMIQEVKIQFNLSSDTEAMRMLISCGYNQVKTLLK
jgi:citrate synthase